jgi:hypothetical protein
MTESIKRNIDLTLAQKVNETKTQLKINDDTEYNIFYDICEENGEKLLYIKLEEITSDAPFYYNRSYSIEQLHKIHKIFKAFDKDDFEDFLSYFKELFDKGRIKLSFADASEEIIKLELNVILVSRDLKLYFELYREMIPTKKDEKLLELYELTKKKLKLLKEIKLFADQLKQGNPQEKEIISKIKEIYNIFEIPGIEKGEEIKKEEEDLSLSGIDPILTETIRVCKTKICQNLSKKYHFNPEKKKFEIVLNLKNNNEEAWPVDNIKLKCGDEEKSNIKYKEVIYPPYEIGKGQEGDFVVKFDEKDLKHGVQYLCFLQLFIGDKKVNDSDIPLNIKVKSKKK